VTVEFDPIASALHVVRELDALGIVYTIIGSTRGIRSSPTLRGYLERGTHRPSGHGIISPDS
jgi:hypothetical protein